MKINVHYIQFSTDKFQNRGADSDQTLSLSLGENLPMYTELFKGTSNAPEVFKFVQYGM